MAGVRFQADALQTLGTRIFAAEGTPDDIAEIISTLLVEANLMGHDSHGVLRIPSYVRQAQQGSLDVAARPRILSAKGATALVSGEWGFGQLAGRLAMDEAIRFAREYGVGAAGAVRCNHLGRVGTYVEQAAAAGCVGMAWVGGLGPRAVPHWGSRRALGTNPMAVGFPMDGEHPVVLDFATTMVAAGKIAAARAAKKTVAPGWIVDRDGQPTTDPEAFMQGGALLPFGEHKGYALSVIVDLLGQALTGADDPRPREGGDTRTERRSGALVCAIDLGAFRPPQEAKGAARRILDRLRAVPPVPGFARVLTPGQPEAIAQAERAETGIELADETWRAISATALAAGLAPNDLPAPLAPR